MDTLNFREIMERNECWYEEYDLTCPYCDGQSERKCQTCGGEETVECLECEASGQIDGHDCRKCGGAGYWICDDCDGSGETHCEECINGSFEVVWNTAFEVKVWDDFRDVDHNSAEWKEAYKLAWDLGFCLIEHGQQRYLLMGMCGQDCTWIIQYTRWKLQGYLDVEDCQQCIGSGGYVFLRDCATRSGTSCAPTSKPDSYRQKSTPRATATTSPRLTALQQRPPNSRNAATRPRLDGQGQASTDEAKGPSSQKQGGFAVGKTIDLQKAWEFYIASGGVLCPVCRSDQIEGGHIEVDAGGASQEITCGQCGSTWVDRYSLVGIDDLQVNEGRE